MVKKGIRRFAFNAKRQLVSILVQDNPRVVALGFGIGTFIALLPTPGLSIFIGLAVAILMKPASRPGILLAMVIWNIWTLIPIYALSRWLGDLLLGQLVFTAYDKEWLNTVLEFVRQLLVGNLIIAIPLSTGSYFLAKRYVSSLRDKRSGKRVVA